ncbi:MAG: iron transporter [Halodesulfurarchaeum sp.]|nr:iron transporter [Halodesulfurarchaeum sp.]
MRRRSFLRSSAAITGTTLLSGCLGRLGFETQSVWRDPPLVTDRPAAVYYPEIVEGMGMYGTTTDGDVGFAVMHSYPHRFWNVTGSRRSKVVVRPDDSIHLMATVWDLQTETILPVDVSTEISSTDGDSISTNLWPMISPTMGFHYGDNIPLPGEKRYEITFHVGPLQAHLTEPFRGRFTEPRSASMEFSFDTSETYNLEIRRLNELAGTRGTVDLEEMNGVPSPVAPKPEALPGRVLDESQSGDATILTGLLVGQNRFRTNDGPFLYVSPRTPYNSVILPRMGLSATIKRDETTRFEKPLQASLDPELGPFYGVSLQEIRRGETVRISVDTPPQLARHDGYETAFIEMDSIEFTVE